LLDNAIGLIQGWGGGNGWQGTLRAGLIDFSDGVTANGDFYGLTGGASNDIHISTLLLSDEQKFQWMEIAAVLAHEGVHVADRQYSDPYALSYTCSTLRALFGCRNSYAPQSYWCWWTEARAFNAQRRFWRDTFWTVYGDSNRGWSPGPAGSAIDRLTASGPVLWTAADLVRMAPSYRNQCGAPIPDAPANYWPFSR